MLRQLPNQRIWYQARKIEMLQRLVLCRIRHLTCQILPTLERLVLQQDDRMRVPQQHQQDGDYEVHWGIALLPGKGCHAQRDVLVSSPTRGSIGALANVATRPNAGCASLCSRLRDGQCSSSRISDGKLMVANAIELFDQTLRN